MPLPLKESLEAALLWCQAGLPPRALHLSVSVLSLALVSGVWPEGSDGTDINAVCRAHEKKLLSTGDDFGKVHLFSYPCSQFRVRGVLTSPPHSHHVDVTAQL